MLYYCPKCKLDKESSEFYMKSDTKRNIHIVSYVKLKMC